MHHRQHKKFFAYICMLHPLPLNREREIPIASPLFRRKLLGICGSSVFEIKISFDLVTFVVIIETHVVNLLEVNNVYTLRLCCCHCFTERLEGVGFVECPRLDLTIVASLILNIDRIEA